MPEPLILFPGPNAETRAHAFIDQINSENEAGSGEIPEGFEPFLPWQPGETHVDFLIRKVDRVVEESSQIGTEPLTTKAGCLAALYQAEALEKIADNLSRLDAGVWELIGLLKDVIENGGPGSAAIRTKPV